MLTAITQNSYSALYCKANKIIKPLRPNCPPIKRVNNFPLFTFSAHSLERNTIKIYTSSENAKLNMMYKHLTHSIFQFIIKKPLTTTKAMHEA